MIDVLNRVGRTRRRDSLGGRIPGFREPIEARDFDVNPGLREDRGRHVRKACRRSQEQAAHERGNQGGDRDP